MSLCDVNGPDTHPLFAYSKWNAPQVGRMLCLSVSSSLLVPLALSLSLALALSVSASLSLSVSVCVSVYLAEAFSVCLSLSSVIVSSPNLKP